jgi:hypothetical protein
LSRLFFNELGNHGGIDDLIEPGLENRQVVRGNTNNDWPKAAAYTL